MERYTAAVTAKALNLLKIARNWERRNLLAPWATAAMYRNHHHVGITRKSKCGIVCTASMAVLWHLHNLLYAIYGTMCDLSNYNWIFWVIIKMRFRMHSSWTLAVNFFLLTFFFRICEVVLWSKWLISLCSIFYYIKITFICARSNYKANIWIEWVMPLSMRLIKYILWKLILMVTKFV